MRSFRLSGLSVGSAMAIALLSPAAIAAQEVPHELSTAPLSSESVGVSNEKIQLAGLFDELSDVLDAADDVLDTVDRFRGGGEQPAAPAASPAATPQPLNGVQVDMSPSMRMYEYLQQPGNNRVEQMFEERRAEQARREAEAARRQAAFEQMSPEEQAAYLQRQEEIQQARNAAFWQMMQMGAEMDAIISGPSTPADEAEAQRQRDMHIRMSRPLLPGESR